ncbi:MAG: sigma-70 family RNA polymerase sigma factor [Chloroflexi bacterium]|nr:sigma-70 family RNA polymerase sigma factor [Chloroflexota bacterium]
MFRLQRQPETDARKTNPAPADIFAELYEHYFPRVFRYVSYRVADTPVAEDLTSVVFEKALTKFKSYSSDKAAFSTWIFAIARNTVIDHYRAASREQSVRLDDALVVSDGRASAEQEVIMTEDIQKLQAHISQLSGQDQEIIALKFGAERNNREIARELGLTESNVGTMIYRAVRKLRDGFQGWRDG